jgi:Ala-tRNA(Pro) deacylase
MSIARKLNRFLTEQRADYEIIAHAPTQSAIATAKSCHIPLGQMAKAVLLDTEQDRLLVVLPANRRLELAELRSDLGTRPHLAQEKELASIFDDLRTGRRPADGSRLRCRNSH